MFRRSMLGALALALTPATPALAAPSDPDPLAVVNRVFNAADQRAELDSLTSAERAAFDAYTTPRPELTLSGVETEVRGDCNTAKGKAGQKADGGNTLYTFWYTLHWCYNKKKGWYDVHTVDHETGGETKTPGWSYKGTPVRRAGTVGTPRGFSQNRFVFSIAGIAVREERPCIRVFLTNDHRPYSDRACTLA